MEKRAPRRGSSLRLVPCADGLAVSPLNPNDFTWTGRVEPRAVVETADDELFVLLEPIFQFRQLDQPSFLMRALVSGEFERALMILIRQPGEAQTQDQFELNPLNWLQAFRESVKWSEHHNTRAYRVLMRTLQNETHVDLRSPRHHRQAVEFLNLLERSLSDDSDTIALTETADPVVIRMVEAFLGQGSTDAS